MSDIGGYNPEELEGILQTGMNDYEQHEEANAIARAGMAAYKALAASEDRERRLREALKQARHRMWEDRLEAQRLIDAALDAAKEAHGEPRS